MTIPNPGDCHLTQDQLDFLLRRAEQESIAAIRSIDPRAAQQHEAMAFAYSARALSLLGDPQSR